MLLQGVEKERGDFVVSMQDRLAKSLGEHYDAMIAKHEAILIRELPEAQDPEGSAGSSSRTCTSSSNGSIKKYYADELKLKLTSLYDAWDRFPAADKPGAGEPELEQQFMGVLLEAVSHRLAESSQAAPAVQ